MNWSWQRCLSPLFPLQRLRRGRQCLHPTAAAATCAIAFLCLPFVLAYSAAIYERFRGKVHLGKFSY